MVYETSYNLVNSSTSTNRLLSPLIYQPTRLKGTRSPLTELKESADGRHPILSNYRNETEKPNYYWSIYVQRKNDVSMAD